LFYSKDSTLFFFDLKYGIVDSISFTAKDFEDAGIFLYSGTSKTEKLILNPYPLVILFIIVVASLFFIVQYLKNKNLKHRNEFLMNSYFINGKKGNGEITVANPESFRENLSEVEKGLLDILVVNTSIDTMTTVTQVNQVLGITNKPLKIQNNIRA
jgi:hypoxanthine-guanine phosphoribosyltransferase